MSAYQYKVVPFIGRIQGSQSTSDVSEQLQSLINQYAAQGWEFHQINDVNIEVRPGCLAGLFGAKTSYVKLDQAIFRMEIAQKIPLEENSKVLPQPGGEHDKSQSNAANASPSMDSGPRGICPNCDGEIALSALECPRCQANFGPNSTWAIKPL